jgi:hypothetical protein
MQRHLHAIRQKPEHIKKRIAVGTAVGITGLVALLWVVTLASTGAFALAPLGSVGAYATADGTGKNSDVASSQTGSESNFSKLLGAVGASSLNGSGSSSAPALTIVDQGSSSSFNAKQAQEVATDTPTTLSF